MEFGVLTLGGIPVLAIGVVSVGVLILGGTPMLATGVVSIGVDSLPGMSSPSSPSKVEPSSSPNILA